MNFDPTKYVSADSYDEHETESKLNSTPPKGNVALELWSDARIAYTVIKNGNIGWRGYSAIALGLAYFVCPVDFMPDFIPVLGYGDDLLVIRWGLNQIAKDCLD